MLCTKIKKKKKADRPSMTQGRELRSTTAINAKEAGACVLVEPSTCDELVSGGGGEKVDKGCGVADEKLEYPTQKVSGLSAWQPVEWTLKKYLTQVQSLYQAHQILDPLRRKCNPFSQAHQNLA
jgi:hypothetical protein